MQLDNAVFVIESLLFCWVIDFSHQLALKGQDVRDVRLTEFPFAVSLLHKNRKACKLENKHFCTGTLVTKDHVLTAKHCLEGEKVDGVELIIGSVDLERGTTYYPKSWVTYEEWASKNKKQIEGWLHDVAIITLDKTVDISYVKPVNLSELGSKALEGSEVKIAGWGRTNGDKPTRVLKTAQLHILSKKECETQLTVLTNDVVRMTEKNLCTKADPWILTDCGDSGGPLLDESNKLVGVTVGRCQVIEKSNYPPDFLLQQGVNLHMSVNYYKEFIQNVTSIN